MNHASDRDAFNKLGKELNQLYSDQLSTQLQVFQSALINFANEHGDQIKQNPEFRSKFTQLCSSIGIDPLELVVYSQSKNNKRTEQFYISLAVKIVEVCEETRDLNGGLISFKELLPRIQHNVNLQSSIHETDLVQALVVLDSLGKGYEVLNIKGKKWLKFSMASTSSNFTTDHKSIYEMCTFTGGFVSHALLRDNYGWDKVRCQTVVDDMISKGFLWVDTQGPNGEWLYWEPSWSR